MGLHRRRRISAPLSAVVVSVVAAGTLVWNVAYAAFSSSTTNAGNAWASGTVAVSNDHSGSAVFSAADVKPDTGTSALAPPGTGALVASTTSAGGSACFKVTYSGSVAANVHLYATVTNTGTDGGLGQFLLLDIDTGTDSAPGTDTNCATYTSSSYLYGSAGNTNAFVNGLPTTYAAGLAGWNGATGGTSKWYRVSWLLPANVANTAQAEQVQVDLVWEAQGS